MKLKSSKLMFLGIMLAFVLAVSFTLTPTASAAVGSTTFSTVGINITGFIYTDTLPTPASASTTPTINFPNKNEYKPFYLCPPAGVDGTLKGKLTYVTLRLTGNVMGSKFLVYSGHRTSGTDIKSSVTQSFENIEVTIQTDKMTTYTSGTDAQGRKWRNYQITVYDPSFLKTTYYNIKMEIP